MSLSETDRQRRQEARKFNERLKAGASAANGAALAMIVAALLAPINGPDGAVRATDVPARAGLIALALMCYYAGYLILGLYQSED